MGGVKGRRRLAVDRFGNTVAKETTGGAEGSCRQSADTLWVNPFKHDLLSSLLHLRLTPPPQPPLLTHPRCTTDVRNTCEKKKRIIVKGSECESVASVL